jgi:cytidylate kinase
MMSTDRSSGPVPRVVAIDGAAGSGKSTLSRVLASRLGLPYVNTGLMYRALTASALARGISSDDEPALTVLAEGLRFTLTHGEPPELEVEGWPHQALVTVEVEAEVSAVARHPRVRAVMRARQRALGEDRGAVMEGRDIGSVVFADARVKLYLEADDRRRAARRVDERAPELDGITADGVEAALHARDARDARTNPHVPAEGAAVIDTTDLDVSATIASALAVIADRAPDLVP